VEGSLRLRLIATLLSSHPTGQACRAAPHRIGHGVVLLPRLAVWRHALPPAAAEVPRGVLGGRRRREHRAGVGQGRGPPRVRRAGGLVRRVRVQSGHCREPGW
jgi:hypothetical protein